MLYEYRAINSEQKKVKGFCEAESEKEARDSLRSRGLMVSHLAPAQNLSSQKSLKGEYLVSFTMQLSQLLAAGVPLYECLQAIEEQYRGESFHSIIVSIANRVKNGSTLSVAMEGFPECFDRLYRSMVASGEAIGQLDTILEKLAEHLQKQLKLKRQVVTTLMYPAILGVFSLLVIGLLLGFVVPSMEAIFEGRELSAVTELVLGLSQIFRNWWAVYLPLLVGLGVGIWYRSTTVQGKKLMQKLLLTLPFLKTLTLNKALSRFSRTMGTMQDGGLTVVDSLRIAKGVLKNVILESEVEHIIENIVQGSSLSKELQETAHFPNLLARMVSVGEETGTLPQMFHRIADIYEGELEKTLSRILTLAQPIILIVMGFVIGIILLAVLLPLTDISALTGG